MPTSRRPIRISSRSKARSNGTPPGAPQPQLHRIGSFLGHDRRDPVGAVLSPEIDGLDAELGERLGQ
jgi:hypothetical protein